MIRKPLLRRTGALLSAVAIAFVATAQAAVAGPFEKAIPQDTIVFATVSNVKALKSKLSETQTAKLFRDPAMQPFIDGVKAEIEKILKMAEEQSGVSAGELMSLPTGQIALAVRLDPENPKSPPYVYLLADVTGNDQKVTSLLARLSAALEEQEMTKQMVGEITVFSKGRPEPRAQLCYAVKSGTFALGNDPEALSASLAAVSGGMADSLGENPRFIAFREQNKGTGDFEIFADVNKIVSVVSEQGDPQAAMAITVFGINAFQSAGLSLSIGRDDFDSIVQLSLSVRGQSALLNLFRMPAESIKIEPWVPQDVVSYSTFTWDFDLFYSTLTGIINGIQPGIMAQVDATLAMGDPNNPLVSLKNDVVGPLGNRISIVTDLAESNGAPVNRTLFGWKLDDSARFNALLERLMALVPNLPLNKKTVKGTTVYTYPLGDMIAAQAPNQDMPIPIGVVGFSVGKTHLFVTTHVELLDKVLNFDGQAGLAENPDFQQVASKLPSQVSSMSFVRSSEQARASWEMLKSGKFADLMQKGVESNPEAAGLLGGLIDSFKGDNLPEFDAIKKYMAPGGGYGIMNDQGYRFVQFSLK